MPSRRKTAAAMELFCHPAGENITWTMETEWPKFKMKARCEEQFIPGKLGTGFVEVCHDLSVSW